MPLTIVPVEWEVRWGPDHHAHGEEYTGAGKLTLAGNDLHASIWCGSGYTLTDHKTVLRFAHDLGSSVKGLRLKDGQLKCKEWKMAEVKFDVNNPCNLEIAFKITDKITGEVHTPVATWIDGPQMNWIEALGCYEDCKVALAKRA